MRLTVHVEPRLVGGGSCSVDGRAGVGAAVLRSHARDVDVAHHRAAHAHILAHHESGEVKLLQSPQ